MTNEEIKQLVDIMVGEDIKTKYVTLTIKRELKERIDATIGKIGKKMYYSDFIKYAIKIIDKNN